MKDRDEYALRMKAAALSIFMFVAGALITIAAFYFAPMVPHPCPVPTDNGVYYQECDTDTDCLEKNGCGGYVDPCDVEV